MSGFAMPRLRLDKVSPASSTSSAGMNSPRGHAIAAQKERTRVLLQERARLAEQRAAAHRAFSPRVAQPASPSNRTTERRVATARAAERARGDAMVEESKHATASLQQQLGMAETELEATKSLWKEEHQRRLEDSLVYQEAWFQLRLVSGLATLTGVLKRSRWTAAGSAVSSWNRGMMRDKLRQSEQHGDCERVKMASEHEAALEHHLKLNAVRHGVVVELQASLKARDAQVAALEEQNARNQQHYEAHNRLEPQLQELEATVALLKEQLLEAKHAKAQDEKHRETLEARAQQAERDVELEKVRCGLLRNEMQLLRDEHVVEAARMYEQLDASQARCLELEKGSHALSACTEKLVELVYEEVGESVVENSGVKEDLENQGAEQLLAEAMEYISLHSR